MFYRQSREFNNFLQSHDSITRINYFRVLALASIDILLTLPFGTAQLTLIVKESISENALTFYPGWKADHVHWKPQSVAYELQAEEGASVLA